MSLTSSSWIILLAIFLLPAHLLPSSLKPTHYAPDVFHCTSRHFQFREGRNFPWHNFVGYGTDVCSLSRGQNSCRFLTINQADKPKTAQADPDQGCGAKRSTRKA